MDISLYRDKEKFNTYDSSGFTDMCPDDGRYILSEHDIIECFENIHGLDSPSFDWSHDNEEMHNGDIAVLPSSNYAAVDPNVSGTFTDKEELNSIFGFQNWGDVSAPSDFIINEDHVDLMDLPGVRDNDKFHLPSFLLEPDDEGLQANYEKLNRVAAGVKKIDMDAKKYIVDEDEDSSDSDNSDDVTSDDSDDETENFANVEDDDVDIETVPEESPILEAGDLGSLLKQFELTSVTALPQDILEKTYDEQPCVDQVKKEPMIDISNIKLELADSASSTIIDRDVDENSNSRHEFIKQESSSAVVEITQDGIVNVREKEDKYKAGLKLVEDVDGKKTRSNDQKPPPKRIVPKPKLSNNKPTLKKQPVNLKHNDSTTSLNTSSDPTSALDSKVTNNNNNHSGNSSKPIPESLSKELIARIKESGKRKPITVIPAIANGKKRGSKSQLEKDRRKIAKIDVTETSKVCNTPGTDAAPFGELPQAAIDCKPSDDTVEDNVRMANSIDLDHSYCGSSSSSPMKQSSRNGKKDSGIESMEDDDSGKSCASEKDQPIQPVVQNADGTLMVSLLKVNTIRSHAQKKKLNLEEYKKRRKVPVTSDSSNKHCMQTPQQIEDEQMRLLKHQEKLRKMAEEVLNAAPNGVKKPDVVLPNQTVEQSPAIVRKQPPPNIETKVLVSFGVNTDCKSFRRNPLAPVETLQAIKPFLEKASSKFSNSSLINAVIETVPKIVDQKSRCNKEPTTAPTVPEEHGENRQVLHLEKDRKRPEMVSICTQTNISLIEQSKKGRVRRPRIESSSSEDGSVNVGDSTNRRSRKTSKSSNSSCSGKSSRCSSSSSSTRSSDYSNRLSSYSRSRSRSPKYSRNRRNNVDPKEHKNAVEERRILYVGRISGNTTKEDLRRKFQKFGPITNVSLHFREHGYSDLENYGFVTFRYKEDAHEAYEHGNDDPAYPYFKISFGGRREFCKTSYADLDNMRDEEYYAPKTKSDNSFDALLKEMKDKLKKRKA